MKIQKTTIIFLLLLSFQNIVFAQNAKREWSRILKSCGSTQLFGNETLFFGPSNTIGIGSVWRKGDDKSYNARFELSDIITDSVVIKKVIKYGQKSNQCSTVRNVTWSAQISFPFLGSIFGQTGLGAEFHKAKRTTISVDNLALDVIKEVPFEVALKSIAAKDPKNEYLLDIINNPGRLIVTKAYRLTGLTVKLDYDPKDLDSLKQKYPNGGSITIGGDKGIKLGFNYSTTSEVTIKLPAEIYIAGEFSKLTANGTINLNDSANIGFDLTPIKLQAGEKIGKLELLKKSQ